MKVKKKKPSYLAYRWGYGDISILQRGICTWTTAELEPNDFGRDARLSVWSQKLKGWKDIDVEYGGWIVCRSDGKIWVLDNYTYHEKYEEDK